MNKTTLQRIFAILGITILLLTACMPGNTPTAAVEPTTSAETQAPSVETVVAESTSTLSNPGNGNGNGSQNNPPEVKFPYTVEQQIMCVLEGNGGYHFIGSTTSNAQQGIFGPYVLLESDVALLNTAASIGQNNEKAAQDNFCRTTISAVDNGDVSHLPTLTPAPTNTLVVVEFTTTSIPPTYTETPVILPTNTPIGLGLRKVWIKSCEAHDFGSLIELPETSANNRVNNGNAVWPNENCPVPPTPKPTKVTNNPNNVPDPNAWVCGKNDQGSSGGTNYNWKRRFQLNSQWTEETNEALCTAHDGPKPTN